jgi:hypothetical protein
VFRNWKSESRVLNTTGTRERPVLPHASRLRLDTRNSYGCRPYAGAAPLGEGNVGKRLCVRTRSAGLEPRLYQSSGRSDDLHS